MKNIIAVLIAVTAVSYFWFSNQSVKPAAQATNQKAFARIMKTGELRCGYFPMPLMLEKDPNTGAMIGVLFDYMTALAEAADIKINWAEEINLATYTQDITNGRYDVECAGGWANALRGKHLYYVEPIAYYPVYAYVRGDDTRFDADYEAINKPEIKAAVLDGETSALIRQRRFPHTTAHEVPQMAGAPGMMLLQVTTGKADVAFADAATAQEFLKSNPNSIKPLKQETLRLIPISVSVARGEADLQQFLNTATTEMQLDGMIERILQKYDPAGEVFIHVQAP
ncbi:MAG: transporter substrate-binding domain-containing protein [Alphaproteobacteria bacterium]|nr:transporter substrate-binding domain-containing protein [Alphaproteobacteria bacterium]